ncbi:hypothetical protein H4R18_005424 [Coemansia javaensis]|uniref:Uncharacterized protein n=1 Tax=Coemansia javaensis TaxID=2761396 RepID=A0A9W8LEC1_9FUNG|nr:hypothetical protein H4R18_005424 [Coemansia javaensis]
MDGRGICERISQGAHYADRSVVGEEAHQSLVLCRSALASGSAEAGVRVACLARIAMVLDALPAVRASQPPASGASALLQQDRCVAYCELAAAHRRAGDAASASRTFRRAAELAEQQLRARPGDAALAALLRQTCDAWADVEDALGRPTQAQRVRRRGAR